VSVSSPSTVRPVVIIPTYNTGAKVLEVVRDVLATGVPTWVVVDGSSDGTAEDLGEIAAQHPTAMRLFVKPVNQGKGAAVLTAAAQATAEGFTHALAFDADGQHPAGDIPRYVSLAREFPHAMIFGVPVFDHHAPLERVIFRRVATFFVGAYSGFSGIGDAMFGMRLFPLRDLVAVMNATSFGRRYDFECEVGIRLCWRGVPVLNVPTKVRYLSKEEGGVSHYHYLRDNARLVTLFLRLMPGASVRAPYLMWRRWTGKSRLNLPAA
jgi:glycosyltransferase involved in cell wall biosynthesis